MSNKKFTVIYDTYCGWCYGAAPVLEALVATGAEVETLHRQLFSGANAHKMADGFGAQAIQIDGRIGELSGQTFSPEYIENILRSKTEILDSKLTAQAAVLVHDKGPEVELSLAARLQEARYVDGASATDRDVVVAALTAEGVLAEDAEKIGSKELEEKAAHMARQAETVLSRVGAGGVPTVLMHVDGKTELVDVARYFGRPEAISLLAA